jgi:hypothetical protein
MLKEIIPSAIAIEAKTANLVAGELHDLCSGVDSERHLQAKPSRNPESRCNLELRNHGGKNFMTTW